MAIIAAVAAHKQLVYIANNNPGSLTIRLPIIPQRVSLSCTEHETMSPLWE
jgi:hypothetical protein